MRRFRPLVAIFLLAVFSGCENDGGMDMAGESGQGGSMARFAINGNHLYLVDHTSIKVFDITGGNFEQLDEVHVGWGMETIFARDEYLYLGARDAMYIYSLEDPVKPSFIFRYQHLVSCDPVVVQGNRAYVTLRSGSSCNRGVNALEIIDISDPYEPALIRNYPMASPHGLGVDGDLLFLCEGEEGLKVFDISDETDIALIEHRDDFFAYDVIPRQGIATVTGEDGIFQFAYGLENQISELSKIPVERPDL
jgi:hypothetical protein